MSQNLRQRSQANVAAKSSILVDGDPKTVNLPKRDLLSFASLPQWATDNEYIHTGYRQISNSYLESFRSCFYVHNETGNIYSHLLAALWMMVLPAILYPRANERYPDANKDDWTVFGLFFVGGILCYSFSVAYHVFTNHSQKVHNLCLRLDLFGITTVTAGCFPPGMWYTFPCADRSTKIFWISVRHKC